MPELTKLRQRSEERGGISATAAELGVSKGVLWAWIARGQVPAERCSEVAALLGMQRHELRPDDWHRIWPELIGQPGAPAIPSTGEKAA